MNTIYLIDLDDVTFEHMRWDFKPNAKERIDEICSNPDNHVYFFSCRGPYDKMAQTMKQLFPKSKGYMLKPHGYRYVYIDDLLDLKESANSL